MIRRRIAAISFLLALLPPAAALAHEEFPIPTQETPSTTTVAPGDVDGENKTTVIVVAGAAAGVALVAGVGFYLTRRRP